MDSIIPHILVVSAVTGSALLVATHGIDGLAWHLWLRLGAFAEGIRQYRKAYKRWLAVEQDRLAIRGVEIHREFWRAGGVGASVGVGVPVADSFPVQAGGPVEFDDLEQQHNDTLHIKSKSGAR